MFALVIALAATMVLTPRPVLAQQTPQNETQSVVNVYTVWSTVLLTRTGERTPRVAGTLPTALTALGAQQAYDAGAFFRARYVTQSGQVSGILYAPLVGLGPDVLSTTQTTVHAVDQQYTIAAAQAFLQGFYPPFAPSSNSSSGAMVDGSSFLANGSYITGPMNGYQYADIVAPSQQDPAIIHLSADQNCPNWNAAAVTYGASATYAAIEAAAGGIYDAVGSALLRGVPGISDPSLWTYTNAYAIYDYLNYQHTHNASAAATLAGYRDVAANTSYLTELRWLADQQQFAHYGNLSATPAIAPARFAPQTGSIATLPGNYFAAQVLSQLSAAVTAGTTGAGTYAPLNLHFADFEPLMAFFALAQLPSVAGDFAGLPDFASTLAFELFSMSNTSTPAAFPPIEELYVRFSFRNGSEAAPAPSTKGVFRSFPLFGNPRSSYDIPWTEFAAEMADLVLGGDGGVEAWCGACGATQAFCAPYNLSLVSPAVQQQAAAQAAAQLEWGGRSPAVAGVIGGVVTLAIAGVLFGLVMLLAGVRVHRVEGAGVIGRHRRRSSADGGFRGGQKMASDQDLTIPKNGVGAVVTKEEEVHSPISPLGHERVGSWELKQQQLGQQQQQQQHPAGQHQQQHGEDLDIEAAVARGYQQREPSFDDIERVDPFRDPVKPREGV